MYNISTLILNSIMFPLITLVGLIGYLYLRHKDWSVRRIPFVLITTLLVLAEGGKQVYELVSDQYNLFSLPFHICTIVIVGYVLVSFLSPNARIAKVFWAMSITAGFVVALGLIIAPNPIIGWQSNNLLDGKATYIEWYSVIAHYIFVLLFVLTLTMKMYSIRLTDIFVSCAIWIGSLVVILVAANTLGINYANFLDFKLPLLSVQELGLPLFQAILFVAYVVVYLATALILYLLYRLTQEPHNQEINNLQWYSGQLRQ
ncbi:MAG: hypothetical protein LBK70_03380 [Clostridiales bacterium]|nr:hypothetical protein [Clostridiales bacterium]